MGLPFARCEKKALTSESNLLRWSELRRMNCISVEFHQSIIRTISLYVSLCPPILCILPVRSMAKAPKVKRWGSRKTRWRRDSDSGIGGVGDDTHQNLSWSAATKMSQHHQNMSTFYSGTGLNTTYGCLNSDLGLIRDSWYSLMPDASTALTRQLWQMKALCLVMFFESWCIYLYKYMNFTTYQSIPAPYASLMDRGTRWWWQVVGSFDKKPGV